MQWTVTLWKLINKPNEVLDVIVVTVNPTPCESRGCRTLDASDDTCSSQNQMRKTCLLWKFRWNFGKDIDSILAKSWGIPRDQMSNCLM